MIKSFPSILLALGLGTSLAIACGGDDDDMGDSGNDEGSDGDGGDGSGGDDAPGDDAPGDDGDGDDAPAEDGGDAPADDGADGGGGGALGDDCTSNADCAENYCLMIEGSGGEMIAFCSRQCVSADDCPEEGWVCNLSPFTACVPDT